MTAVAPTYRIAPEVLIEAMGDADVLGLVRRKLPQHSIEISLECATLSLWFPNCESGPNAEYSGKTLEEALARCWADLGQHLESLPEICSDNA